MRVLRLVLIVFYIEIITTSRFLKTLPIVSKQKAPIYLYLYINIKVLEKYPIVLSFTY